MGLTCTKAMLKLKQLEMNMPDALTATKEYLDQLSEDDTFGVPAILRHGVENAAAEARDELSCNYTPWRPILGSLLII